MHLRRGFKAAPRAFHLKCPPGNLETLLRKNFFYRDSLFKPAGNTKASFGRENNPSWRLARAPSGNSTFSSCPEES